MTLKNRVFPVSRTRLDGVRCGLPGTALSKLVSPGCRACYGTALPSRAKVGDDQGGHPLPFRGHQATLKSKRKRIRPSHASVRELAGPPLATAACHHRGCCRTSQKPYIAIYPYDNLCENPARRGTGCCSRCEKDRSTDRFTLCGSVLKLRFRLDLPL